MADGDSLPNSHDIPVIYRMLERGNSTQSLTEKTTAFVLEGSKLISRAARRQVISDTLRCCVVTEMTPELGNEEALIEFVSDFDGKALGIVSIETPTDPDKMSIARVETRHEGENIPRNCEVDMSLANYMDCFTSEEFSSQLPLTAEGFADVSEVVKVTKVNPWFDEFVETVSLDAIRSAPKIMRTLQSSFSRMKRLYLKLSSKAASIYNIHWFGMTRDKLAVLKRNFPRGILGYRALLRPNDPHNIRALLVKPSDMSHILAGTKKKTEAEEKEVLNELGPKASKYATLPDLSSCWRSSDLPSLRWIDTNRVIHNMYQVENNLIDEMAPWSLGEIRVFLERLAVYAKNFKRIAQVLPDKTEKDCVDLYYRFKIHLGMKQIISAGIQSRQDRRNSSSNGPGAVTYKQLIDDVMDELEEVVGSGKMLWNHKQLETLTIRKISDSQGIPAKVYGQVTEGDDSPRRERRNALIDVLTNVIARGHPVPSQLASIVETTSAVNTPSLPALTPQPRLSVVRTEIAVLPSRTETPDPNRQLQAHNTI
jgi:hypothetical protein